MTPQEKFLKQSLDKEIEILREGWEDQNRLLKEQLQRIEKDIYVVKVIVAGNGDPSKSLVVRLDRIEQAHHRSVWLTRTAIAASISAIVGLAVLVIKNYLFK